jgi:hypothetical protein
MQRPAVHVLAASHVPSSRLPFQSYLEGSLCNDVRYCRTRKEKTTPFAVDLIRSGALYRASHSCVVAGMLVMACSLKSLNQPLGRAKADLPEKLIA